MSMTSWPEIACTRGHADHRTRAVHVDLKATHGYADYPQVPEWLAVEFDIAVYDPDRYPVDNGDYCPAHDAVSETIVNQGIWEPCETTLTLAVCQGHPGEVMLDFGAQLGWFTLLALSQGLAVCAIDADAANLSVLRKSVRKNGWQERLETKRLRVGPDTPAKAPAPVRLAKIDLEGADHDAVRMLMPSIERRLVEHLLIEISPGLEDGYPELVQSVVNFGYEAFLLPDKSTPPARLEEPDDLERLPSDAATLMPLVAGWRQKNVWFKAQGADW